MRIAYGAIKHETNTFSTVRTREEDFHLWRGEKLVEGKFWEEFRDQGVTVVPTLIAAAFPGGLIERDAYLRFKDELLGHLAAALPVDGVYLPLHGATEVEGVGSGESDLVAAIRRLVGPDTLIAASLDLHGNIAPDLAENANILTAFRTFPHRDDLDTRRRAVRHLIRAFREGLKPETAIVKVPLLIPGEYAVTDVDPARSLYERLGRIEREPGMMDASLLTGCTVTDAPHTSVSVLVVSEHPGSGARRHAMELARVVWERRQEFGPLLQAVEPEEAVARALTSPEGPVFIDDTGDNFTAGAAGDTPVLLRLLLDAGARDAVMAGIMDPEAVSRCVGAGEGARLALEIGGKRDATNASPLEVTGTVAHLPPEQPEWAVFRVGGVQVILTSRQTPFFGPGAFEPAGIDPLRAKVIAVKHLFPGMEEIARASFYALTPGFTDWHLDRRPYRRLSRPIYPLDPETEWGSEG